MNEQEKKSVSIYIDLDTKENIENFFLDCRIKNFQDGYREILSLGFKEFKKLKKEGKKC